MEKPVKQRIYKRISHLICAYCGNKFTALRKDSLYCTRTCAVYACVEGKTKRKLQKNGKMIKTALPATSIPIAIKPPNVIKKPLEVKKKVKKSPELKSIMKQLLELKHELFRLEHTYGSGNANEEKMRREADIIRPQIEELEKKKKPLLKAWKNLK